MERFRIAGQDQTFAEGQVGKVKFCDTCGTELTECAKLRLSRWYPVEQTDNGRLPDKSERRAEYEICHACCDIVVKILNRKRAKVIEGLRHPQPRPEKKEEA